MDTTQPGRLARILLGVVIALVAACNPERQRLEAPVERDWAEIQAGDTLVLLTTYNSTSFFVYRGEPMGFEYELMRAFANDHDLVLMTAVNRSRADLLNQLARGEGDIIGARLVPERDDDPQITFSTAIYETRPMLVQRTDAPAELDLPAAVDSLLRLEAEGGPAPQMLEVQGIGQPGELAGETVHLPQYSPYVGRMVELSDSVTGEIEVVVVSESSYERLIRGVSLGQVDLVVAPENLARLREGYLDNISVTPAMGPTHPVALGLRPSSPELLARLNEWLEENSALREQLFQRYFIDRQAYHARVESEYLTSETGRLSQFDELFQRHVQRLGWDWRLLAALAYQESEFLPTARSWAGAQGLLQLMPRTARALGVSNVWDPEDNVSGGTRFLVDLTTRWTPLIHDPEERLKFILASYNVGPGHVDDARRLTDEYGGDSQVWDDVAYWLLQKSKREVYTLPVVRHGFARGLEPVTYVSKILERYAHYRQFVPSGPDAEVPES